MERPTISDQVKAKTKHLNFKSKSGKNFQDLLDNEIDKKQRINRTNSQRKNRPVFGRPNIALQIELQSSM